MKIQRRWPSLEIIHLIPRYIPAVSGEAITLHNIAKRLVLMGHEVEVFTTNAIDATAMYSLSGEVSNKSFEIIDGVKVYRFPINYRFLAKFKHIMNRNRFLYDTEEIYAYTKHIKETVTNGMKLNNFLNNLFLSSLVAQFFVPRAPISNKLLRKLLEKNPDFYHVHGIPTSTPIYGYIASKKTKKPLIIKLAFHASDKLYYSSLIFKVLRKAKAIIGNTIADINILKKFGIPKEKIVITGDGIDLAQYKKPKKEILNAFRERYMLDNYNGVILFLGRLQREKGVFNTINATIRLNKEGKCNVKLLIAGPEYGNASNIIRKYEKKYKFISYLGTISNIEKVIALYNSDILVVPSIVESFGIVYIEAWACKRPVIGADIPSTRALISYGKDGFFVKFWDIQSLSKKIKHLIKNENERKKMGICGFTKVKNNYTEKIVFEKVYDIYQKILEG